MPRRKIHLEVIAEDLSGSAIEPNLQGQALVDAILQAYAATMVAHERAKTGRDHNRAAFRAGHLLFAQELTGDVQYVDYFVMTNFLNQYLHGTAKIYKMAEEFGRHLARTKLDLPMSVIPSKLGWTHYFEFPDGLTFTNYLGDTFYGCAIAIGTSNGVDRTITIVAPDYDGAGVWKKSNSLATLSNKFTTIEECLDVMPSRDGSGEIVPREMVGYVLKCLVYVQSEKPDLTPVVGHKVLTSNPRKAKRQVQEHCAFDVINVGYAFHGRLVRHVTETKVAPHFRWQPCGPGRLQVKLIWINEHTRTFKDALAEGDASQLDDAKPGEE